jgi:hypothetical protein
MVWCRVAEGHSYKLVWNAWLTKLVHKVHQRCACSVRPHAASIFAPGKTSGAILEGKPHELVVCGVILCSVDSVPEAIMSDQLG